MVDLLEKHANTGQGVIAHGLLVPFILNVCYTIVHFKQQSHCIHPLPLTACFQINFLMFLENPALQKGGAGAFDPWLYLGD